MRIPKFSVMAKILCAGALSYLTYHSIKQEEMATKSCANDCHSRIQKLKVYCPPAKNFIVTGNWKMNGDKKLAEEMIKLLRCGPTVTGNDVILGVPAPYLDFIQQRKPKFVEVAAQNIYKEGEGAYTGEISAEMLLDIGVRWVILGASERRIYFNEDYEFIGEKAKFALEKGLRLNICVGETQKERECKEHVKAVIDQLEILKKYIPNSKWKQLVLAYEPLWSLGTDRSVSIPEAKEMIRAIRKWVAETIDEDSAYLMRIQIGGPLSTTIAEDLGLVKDVDGFYVGPAPSLKPDFIAIINSNLPGK